MIHVDVLSFIFINVTMIIWNVIRIGAEGLILEETINQRKTVIFSCATQSFDQIDFFKFY